MQRSSQAVLQRTIESYDRSAPHHQSAGIVLVTELMFGAVKLMGSNPRVLDVGCGHGKLIPYLHEMGVTRYEGIDGSRGMLDIARNEHPKASFRHERIENCARAFGRAAFDGFMAIFSLYHLPPDIMEQAFYNLSEVTRKTGVGYMHMYIDKDESTYEIEFAKVMPCDPGSDFGVMTGFTISMERLERITDAVGFDIVDIGAYPCSGQLAEVVLFKR